MATVTDLSISQWLRCDNQDDNQSNRLASLEMHQNSIRVRSIDTRILIRIVRILIL